MVFYLNILVYTQGRSQELLWGGGGGGGGGGSRPASEASQLPKIMTKLAVRTTEIFVCIYDAFYRLYTYICLKQLS